MWVTCLKPLQCTKVNSAHPTPLLPHLTITHPWICICFDWMYMLTFLQHILWIRPSVTHASIFGNNIKGKSSYKIMFTTFSLSSLIFFSLFVTFWPLKCFEQKIPVNSLITSDKCKILQMSKDNNILPSSKSNVPV